jgi:REP element-mobilizing transposase RayT
LKEQADKYALELIGYCLMSNHVHIIANGRLVRFGIDAINSLHGRLL